MIIMKNHQICHHLRSHEMTPAKNACVLLLGQQKPQHRRKMSCSFVVCCFWVGLWNRNARVLCFHHCKTHPPLTLSLIGSTRDREMKGESNEKPIELSTLLFEREKKMRQPGIEPGPCAWKAQILTIELLTRTHTVLENPGFDPGASCLQSTHSSD